ncbi:MAG: CinA family nicotinamide mononucleotide deamidase-related protein [Candidatus Aquicultorales bacterium]
MGYWILTVGSELLTGLTVDTNSRHIAARLGREGYVCDRTVAVPDDAREIAGAVEDALRSSQGLIVTGGLGPTADDVTREGISQALEKPLRPMPGLRKYLDAWYTKLSAVVPETVYRQAYIPEGAVELVPETGTAAGFISDKDGIPVVALPGVPREMSEMLERALPFLRERMKTDKVRVVRDVITLARSESWLEAALADMFERDDISLGVFAKPGEITLQLRASASSREEADRILDQVDEELKRRLRRLYLGPGDTSLSQVVGELLTAHSLTLAVGESCTGGLLAKTITDHPGSSAFFKTGVVSYSNEAKIEHLGVSRAILERYGAVSPECAIEMAKGARRLPPADIGLSITGLAGPGGGTPEKPVGLIYIGLSSGEAEDVRESTFPGTRWAIRERATQQALNLLRNYLLDKEGAPK